MDISTKTNAELLEMATRCLLELQDRAENGPANIVFKQTKGTLLYQDGIPADRKCWLYLPCLEGVSHLFQPCEDINGKTYRKLLLPGTTLQFSGLKGKRVVIIEGDGGQIIEVNGSFVSGSVKAL